MNGRERQSIVVYARKLTADTPQEVVEYLRGWASEQAASKVGSAEHVRTVREKRDLLARARAYEDVAEFLSELTIVPRKP